jgi:hypothetical protein
MEVLVVKVVMAVGDCSGGGGGMHEGVSTQLTTK